MQINLFAEETQLQRLSELGDSLEKLNVIDFESFRPLLEKVNCKERKSKAGRPSYDVVMMFKILVLQRLFNLSDDQTEYQITDRMSFQRFIGLSLGERVPDAKTIWLFKDTITQKEIIEPLFNQFTAQLESQGILSAMAKRLLQLASAGATRNALTKTMIEQLELELPKLDEQKRIVAVLDSLQSKIQLNQKINDHLEQQAAALYEKYFPYAVTDELPIGWRIGTIGEIVEIHDSKRIPLSGAQRAKMKKPRYPYYGAASLMDYVDEYIFDGKYLLLGEDGTVVDDAGYPILQYVWGQFWVNNHAHILTGKLGFNVETLLLLFKRTPVKSIVTGAVQPKISQANLRSIKVVVPPQSELKAFSELICPLFDQIRQNQDQNKALTAMRDALLPKLMSGELDVSAVQL